MKQGSTNSEPGVPLTSNSKSLDIEIGHSSGSTNTLSPLARDTDTPSNRRNLSYLKHSSSGTSATSLSDKSDCGGGGSGLSKKVEITVMIDSDLELDFEADEELSSSQNSVLLFTE